MVYAPSKCILYVNRIKKYSFLISFGYMEISKNVCFGIALLTSKLLSLGGLLLGLEHNNSVAIYNVSSTNYTIKDATELVRLNFESVPFLLWITGEAYNEK